MKMLVFSIYDAKLEAFGQPFFMQKEAIAIREFTDAVNKADQNNKYYNHPEDYSLWLVATWDDEKGEFDNRKPKNILGALSVTNKNIIDKVN